MNKKSIFIVSFILGILLIIVVLLLLFSDNKKPDSGPVTKPKAEEEIMLKTEEQIGGVIIKDGFDISYESNKNRVIITVTDEPFKKNREKALAYLKDMGIDVCKINLIVLPGKGITPAEDPLNIGC